MRRKRVSASRCLLPSDSMPALRIHWAISRYAARTRSPSYISLNPAIEHPHQAPAGAPSPRDISMADAAPDAVPRGMAACAAPPVDRPTGAKDVDQRIGGKTRSSAEASAVMLTMRLTVAEGVS